MYNNNIGKKSLNIQKRTYIKITIVFCFAIFLKSNVSFLFFRTEIKIDNRIKYDIEDNINFQKYSTTIKPIVIYNQHIDLINKESLTNNSLLDFNDVKFKRLENQINLAKNHGIYGFGIYYFWPFERNNFNEVLDIIFQNKNLNIKFFLIWNFEEREENKNINITKFFNDIRKYIIDSRYIRFENKSVIGINFDDIKDNEIKFLRQMFKESQLGDIYILSNINDNNINNSNKINIFDGLYYSTKYDSLEKVNHYNKTFGYFYTHLIYYNLLLDFPINNIFRTSEAMIKYPIYLKKTRTYIYGDYSPEKFYFLNKVIIDWTLKNHNNESQYIFISDFNNLEKDNSFGYANINSFSKALYGVPFINNNFNLSNLQNCVLTMVQAHVYYIDLLNEVVNKTNNIPVPFDLYITTNTNEKKIFIENYLNKNTKANKFEVLITQNKGRDIIPLLTQLKDIWRNYKYFCHIHTKKHLETDKLGYYWQVYLYENLLGNKNIVSSILSEFEKHDKLGIIFPEHFYLEIRYAYSCNPSNIKHLNDLLTLLFPEKKLKIKEVRNFPVGNMFWARTIALHQIFNEIVIKSAPEENGQIDGTILHAIERFWIYLAKLNGFDYKTILYYI